MWSLSHAQGECHQGRESWKSVLFLDREGAVPGRDASHGIVLDDREVLMRHPRVVRKVETLSLEDLWNMNGTRDGERGLTEFVASWTGTSTRSAHGSSSARTKTPSLALSR